MFSKHRFVRMVFTPPLVCVLSSISASGSASAADAQAQQSTANSRAGICRLGCWLFFTVCRLALRSDVRAEPRAGTVVLEDDDVVVALVRPGAARPAGAHGAHGLAQAHAQRLRADLVGDELRARDHVREHIADDGGGRLAQRRAVFLRRLAELAAQDVGRVAPEPCDDRGVKALDAVGAGVGAQRLERQRAQAAVIVPALDLEQQRHASAERLERLGKRRDDAVGLSETQRAQLGEGEIINDALHAALRIVYQKEADRTLKTPDGETFVLEDTFTEDEFAAITSQVTNAEGKTVTNHDYTNYVVPARQAYAHQTTLQHPGALIGFIALLLVVLVSMATFRSPAVALMPDVTIKPLRSKANAVINLMGTGGGILVLAIGMGFATSSVRNSLMSYTAYFSVIAGLMVLALLIFRLTVNEPKFVAEMQADSKRFGIDNGDDGDTPAASGKLGKAERRSLIFLLLSIVLWFFGYNAVTSKYSVYASNILHKDYNLTLMLAQAAAIVAYLPVGIVASKIGRKKTILGGVVMLAIAFGVAAFLNSESPTMLMNAMFCLAGIGWATINVNSFPMVVEMCSGSDVGRYTGFYYTASMAAQVITPMFSGFLMDKVGMTVLFPYAAIFVAGAFVTMLFVRHGDSRPIAAMGLEALDMDD